MSLDRIRLLLVLAALAVLAVAVYVVVKTLNPPGPVGLRASLASPGGVTSTSSGARSTGPLSVDGQRRWGWSGRGARSFRWTLPGAAGSLRVSTAGPAGLRVALTDAVTGRREESEPLAAGWNDLTFELAPVRDRRNLELALLGCPDDDRATCGWGQVRFEPRRRWRREAPLNLLFVLVDTTRFDAIGAYGGRNETPTIDAIARDGVLFERMYAQASWTLPSVSSLLTARWPNESPGWQLGKSIPDSVAPLAEMLAGDGFHTAAFVANPLLTEEAGFGRGFETFWGSPLADSVFTPGAAVADRAAGWLATHQRERFFLYLHFMDPHDPYAPPARRPKSGEPWPGTPDPAFLGAAPFPDAATLRSWRALYDEEVAYVDEQLARVLSALAPEVRERTAIVVTSDHGEEFLDHGFLKHGATLFEEVVRVPFVMSIPGRVDEAKRVPELARLVDVVPTLVDLLDVKVPPPTRAAWAGVSLAPALAGDAPMPRLVSLGETFGWGAFRWYATDGRSKVVLYCPRLTFPRTSADPFTKRWIEAHTPLEAVYEIGDAAPWDRRVEPPAAERLRWGRELATQYGSGRRPGVWVFVRGLGKGGRLTVDLSMQPMQPMQPMDALDVVPLFWRPGETVELTSGRPGRVTLKVFDDGTPRLVLLEGATVETARSLRASSTLPSTDRPRRPGADRTPGVYWWWEAAQPQSHADEGEETLKRLRALGYAN